MTPQTEANINEAIDWLQQTGGSIQSFAVEQAPLYCREVVAWEIWRNSIFGGIGLVLITLGTVALLKFLRWMEEDEGEPNGRTVSASLIAAVCLIPGPVMTLQYTSQAIKAVVFPRLVIVEHLAGLRK